MQKLKKLLVLLICIVLAGCSGPSNAFNSEGRLTKEEMNNIESENQISSKISSSESSKVNNPNSSNQKKYKSQLGKLLVEEKRLSQIFEEAGMTDSDSILQTIKTETDIDFSQISECKGEVLYKAPSVYNGETYGIMYSKLIIPSNQLHAVQAMLEAIPSNGDSQESWKIYKNYKYKNNTLEGKLTGSKQCIEYSRNHYIKKLVKYLDTVLLIAQKNNAIIYIFRELCVFP